MPPLDAKLILTFLGPLFLVLAGLHCWRSGALSPQGRTWLLVGVIFSSVAAWLWQQS